MAVAIQQRAILIKNDKQMYSGVILRKTTATRNTAEGHTCNFRSKLVFLGSYNKKSDIVGKWIERFRHDHVSLSYYTHLLYIL